MEVIARRYLRFAQVSANINKARHETFDWPAASPRPVASAFSYVDDFAAQAYPSSNVC
jgi:hypothetical protein